MDCNLLHENAHTLLRVASLTARGGQKRSEIHVLSTVLGDVMDVRLTLQDLEDEGHIVREGGAIRVTEGCTHPHLVDKNGSDWRFPALEMPSQVDTDMGLVDKVRAQRGHREPPLGGFPIIAREAISDKQTIKFPYSYIEQTANGGGEIDKVDAESGNGDLRIERRRRIERRVDSPWRARYLDKPVATWTPMEFAYHWDSQTLQRLWGKSPDRTNIASLASFFADLLAEGLDHQTVHQMIETYIDRTATSGKTVPSLWRSFIASKAEMFTKAGQPQSVARFDRSSPEEDGDPWR